MVQLAPVSLHGKEVVADPTPMGLLGLAIGCAALTPIAFGRSLTPAGLETAALFCLLFGAGCQLFAGLLNLVNRNLYGGTLFLTFAFNWVVNAWALHSLAKGFVPDPTVIFATEVCLPRHLRPHQLGLRALLEPSLRLPPRHRPPLRPEGRRAPPRHESLRHPDRPPDGRPRGHLPLDRLRAPPEPRHGSAGLHARHAAFQERGEAPGRPLRPDRSRRHALREVEGDAAKPSPTATSSPASSPSASRGCAPSSPTSPRRAS